jgi:hypothetical protein
MMFDGKAFGLTASLALSLCACLLACDGRDESGLGAEARRNDCLAQVGELEAAAHAAEARARESLQGVSPEAGEVIRSASREIAAANRRAAEILRQLCRSGGR